MIVEHAILPVRAGKNVEFESAFDQARPLISSQPGFRSLSLPKSIESPDSYLLLVEWDSVEAHTEGFRASPEYQRWKTLLHHFYEPFPDVGHFDPVPPVREMSVREMSVAEHGSIETMVTLSDVETAFAYGDSVLAGETVRLRALREDDLPVLARWETDPGRMATLTDWVVPPSEMAAKDRIGQWCANVKDDVGFAIETVDDPPVLVGCLGLHGARPKDRCATVGIALGREHIGRGYGTDAMRAIVAYGFREMGLHRIQLAAAPFNAAGLRAYEKAGFVEEGRRRRAVWHDGAWYDEVLMSILVDEWAASTT